MRRTRLRLSWDWRKRRATNSSRWCSSTRLSVADGNKRRLVEHRRWSQNGHNNLATLMSKLLIEKVVRPRERSPQKAWNPPAGKLVEFRLATTRGFDVDKRSCSKESRNNHIECSILKSVKGSEFSLSVSQTQQTGQKMSLSPLL